MRLRMVCRILQEGSTGSLSGLREPKFFFLYKLLGSGLETPPDTGSSQRGKLESLLC